LLLASLRADGSSTPICFEEIVCRPFQAIGAVEHARVARSLGDHRLARAFVHEVPFGDAEVNGVAFLDEGRLAVTPADGNMLIVSTDPGELIGLVRASVTRGFTLPGVRPVQLGDECPTLAELRGPAPGSDVLAGTCTITWTTSEFIDAMTAGIEDFLGGPLPGGAPDGMHDLAAELACEYTFTFADGKFDVTRDTMEEPFCTGTYSVRGDRVWLSSERGWCIEVKFFDATFELSDGELRLDPESFRGILPFEIVFATRPLEKVS
jgi:hypothetical protein